MKTNVKKLWERVDEPFYKEGVPVEELETYKLYWYEITDKLINFSDFENLFEIRTMEKGRVALVFTDKLHNEYAETNGLDYLGYSDEILGY